MTQNKLTDEQVVRVLAERLGWTLYEEDGGWWLHNPRGATRRWCSEDLARAYMHMKCEAVLTSHDDLRPVLATLTPEEWQSLHGLLTKQQGNQPFWGSKVTHWLLTLPPSKLAHAIAEVLK